MECRRHPEEEAKAVCEKFGVGYCRLCCDDPDLPEGCGCSSPRQHCKFRSQCLVWEMSRKRRKSEG
jgi:hypothetical protein